MTVPNLVTAIRTIGAVVFFALAQHTGDEQYNYIGLAVYWILDIADGALARALDQETRQGAQFDIFSDRISLAFFYVNYVGFHGEALIPVCLFLIEFMVIDQYLSVQFMRFPIVSPNYFAEVHEGVYKWNWSPPAKAVNSGFVTIALILGQVWVAGFVCAALLIVKGYSLALLQTLDPLAPDDATASSAIPASSHG